LKNCGVNRGAVPSCEILLAAALEFTTPALGLDTAHARCTGRLRGTPCLRTTCGLPNHRGEAIQRVEAIAVLAAMALCGDRDDAVATRAVPGQPDETRAHIFGQGRRMRGVEAKLYGSGDLVDVLTTRPGSAYERNGYLVVFNLDPGHDLEHVASIRLLRPRFQQQEQLQLPTLMIHDNDIFHVHAIVPNIAGVIRSRLPARS